MIVKIGLYTLTWQKSNRKCDAISSNRDMECEKYLVNCVLPQRFIAVSFPEFRNFLLFLRDYAIHCFFQALEKKINGYFFKLRIAREEQSESFQFNYKEVNIRILNGTYQSLSLRRLESYQTAYQPLLKSLLHNNCKTK